jgi:MFS superfamily sulfate permease-like transporter
LVSGDFSFSKKIHFRSFTGIIGGIVIGILSAILLIMFLIYRMRKKDEGSYALEEAPRKSPSHAYTRVSSREFFA